MDKIKTVKIKNPNGSVSEETYTIAVDARNVDMENGKELQETIGTINIDNDGDISNQLKNLKSNKINKIDIIDNLESNDKNKVLSANQGKEINDKLKKKPYYYNNVAEMKADTKLKAGDMAVTLGYYETNDGGGAEYRIVKGTYIDDGGNYHKLENNLYAELILNDEFINILQYGIKKDDENFDSTNILKTIFSKYDNIYFPNGSYYINDMITIANKTLIGESYNNVFLIQKSQATAGEHPLKFNGINFVKNIAFKKIFSIFDSANGEKLVSLFNCHDNIFEDCCFICDGYRCGAELDLYTNNQNIKFLNCYFKLYSVKQDGTCEEGGIWIREVGQDKITENIYFDNCLVEHESLDEAFASWHWLGTVRNIFVNNTSIIGLSRNAAPHFLTLGGLNVNMTNCYLENKGEATALGSHIIGTIFNNNKQNNVSVYIDNCKIFPNNQPVNGITNSPKIVISNSYIENNYHTLFGEGVYKNIHAIVKTLSLGEGDFFNSYIKVTDSNGQSLSQGGFRLENLVIDGLNYTSGSILFQLFKSSDLISIKNCSFNGNLNPAWFIWCASDISIGKLIIENTNIDSIWQNNAIEGGYINNCTCTHNIEISNPLKVNNLFNINS